MRLDDFGATAGTSVYHSPIHRPKPRIEQLAAHARHADSVEEWLPLAQRLDLTEDTLRNAVECSRRNATSVQRELLAAKTVTEDALYRAIADHLGLGFVDAVDPDRLVVSDTAAELALRSTGGLPVMRYYDYDAPLILWAPSREPLARLAALAGGGERRARLRITTPSALRIAVAARQSGHLLRHAVSGLADRYRAFSARRVCTGWQGFVLGAMAVLAMVMAVLETHATLITFHLGPSLFFAGCVVLRIFAATRARPLRLTPIRRYEQTEMPVYSVLVALHREAEIVPELLVALGRLEWPRSKLEIKLVCEADDEATLAALDAHELHPCVEVIAVPPCQPRTKPKALAFALPFCSGEIVALYDAEDRPHPHQLLEAWQRFQDGPPTLACVQAPLVVARTGAAPIPLLFGFEYAALFRGLLPWLAERRTLVPLGGTSNHFRGLM